MEVLLFDREKDSRMKLAKTWMRFVSISIYDLYISLHFYCIESVYCTHSHTARARFQTQIDIFNVELANIYANAYDAAWFNDSFAGPYTPFIQFVKKTNAWWCLNCTWKLNSVSRCCPHTWTPKTSSVHHLNVWREKKVPITDFP